MFRGPTLVSRTKSASAAEAARAEDAASIAADANAARRPNGAAAAVVGTAEAGAAALWWASASGPLDLTTRPRARNEEAAPGARRARGKAADGRATAANETHVMAAI